MTELEYYGKQLELIHLFDNELGSKVLENLRNGYFYQPVDNEKELWKQHGIREFISGIELQVSNKTDIEEKIKQLREVTNGR